MKWMIVTLVFFLSSCIFSTDHLVIDHEKVRMIKILNRQDSSVSILTDPIVIEGFLGKFINGAWREPMKFLPNYELDIKEIDTSYRIYINNQSINCGGSTYRSIYNVEEAINEQFK